MKPLGIYLLILLVFSACAKLDEKFGRLDLKTSKIQLDFSRSGMSTSGTLAGGLLIYITGEPGTPFRKSVLFSSEDTANGAIIDMPIGNYKMSAIGFTGSGLTGNVYCAKAENGNTIILDKSTKTISMRLFHANCNDTYFTSSANQYLTTQGFRSLQFVSCQAGTNMAGFTTASACGAAKGDINHTRSVNVRLLSYVTGGQNPDSSHTITSINNCSRGEGKPLSNPATGTGAATGGQAFFALSNNIMFFGEASGGIFRSTDGGANFSQPASLNTGNIFEISGTGTNVIAVGTANGGIHRSTDSGATWSNAAQNTGTFYSVHAEGSAVIAGKSVSAQVYISTNSGSTYTARTATGISGGVETVFYHGATSTFYAGGMNGSDAVVVKSTDAGVTWSNFKTVTGGTNTWVFKILGGKYFIGTSTEGLLVSSDGTTWSQYCNSGCASGNGTIPNNSVNDVIVNNGTWYVATNTDLGVGVNNGTVWENYGATELGTSGVVKKIGFANGKLFFNRNGIASSMRHTDSRGNGALFPTSSPGSWARLPYGGSIGSPFAAKVEVFGNGACIGTPDREFVYPLGLAHEASVSSPAGESAFRDGGGSAVLFLRDF